ncbi:MAG: hypothetical protein M0R05_02175 [Bacilli bacterium]|nr:hypothetical protein [Bacilli bacterium]MDD4078069.1 hypothetical protein [Bacilli bacterium]MDD4389136.1 hypothetical protein [Bacilli bacterium]
MDYRKSHYYKKIFFGIFGLLIIPVYSYLFALNGPGGDLIIVTFSQIGSRYGAIESLIFWGIIMAMYYFTFLNYLFFLTGSKSILFQINLALSCLSILVTVFLPFAPSMFPLAAKTHNFLARVSAISCAVTLLIFNFAYLKIDKIVFYKTLAVFILVVFINIFVLFYFGISSLFQIVLSATFCPYLFLNLIFLEKSPHFDIYAIMEKAAKAKEESRDIF